MKQPCGKMGIVGSTTDMGHPLTGQNEPSEPRGVHQLAQCVLHDWQVQDNAVVKSGVAVLYEIVVPKTGRSNML